MSTPAFLFLSTWLLQHINKCLTADCATLARVSSLTLCRHLLQLTQFHGFCVFQGCPERVFLLIISSEGYLLMRSDPLEPGSPGFLSQTIPVDSVSQLQLSGVGWTLGLAWFQAEWLPSFRPVWVEWRQEWNSCWLASVSIPIL